MYRLFYQFIQQKVTLKLARFAFLSGRYECMFKSAKFHVADKNSSWFLTSDELRPMVWVSRSMYIIPTGNKEKSLEIVLFLRNLPFAKLLNTVCRNTQCVCLAVSRRLSWMLHRICMRLRGAGRIGIGAAGIDKSPAWRCC